MPGERPHETATATTATATGRDGTRIAYRVVGEGQVSVVFLHGWGASGTGRFWNQMLEHLDPQGLRLILMDLRGHGESAYRASAIAQLAGDVLAVLDAEGVGRAVLVGHSVGARVAVWLSSGHPDRVSGQVLLAAVPPLALPFSDQLLDSWLAARATRDAWATLLAGFTAGRPSERAVDDYYADASRADERGLRTLFNVCREDPFADRLPAVVCPTLVVAGTHDQGFPPALLRDTVQRPIGHARLTVVDCGHELPLERPDVTAALLEAFLTGR